MTGDEELNNNTEQDNKKSIPDKAEGHRERMLRTGVACFMGILTGILSLVVIGNPGVPPGDGLSILGWLFLLAGIVFQKHIFMVLGIDYSKLGGKDWFYQAFMTFAFWFITWTILLTL